MKTIIFDKNKSCTDKIMACIGYFDAMHSGHRQLIDLSVSQAKKNNCLSAMICFDPDPLEVIRQSKQDHLFSFRERKKLIKESGIDVLIIIPFDESLMKCDPIDFINDYLNKLNIVELFCGFDYSFGYKGKGNPELLKKYGHFKVTIVPEYKYYGKKVSSTRIKKELNKANFKLVNKLLGFDYYQIVKVLNVSENGSKWLIKAVPAEKDIMVLPRGNFEYYSFDGKCISFVSDEKLKTGDRYKLCL